MVNWITKDSLLNHSGMRLKKKNISSKKIPDWIYYNIGINVIKVLPQMCRQIKWMGKINFSTGKRNSPINSATFKKTIQKKFILEVYFCDLMHLLLILASVVLIDKLLYNERNKFY